MINFDKSNGLVPAIIQDEASGQVLMLGYMDKPAYAQTKKSGKVTFYSRSKGRLWTKGEESGNFLNLVDIKEDCDSDALLISVRPEGPTCHTGSYSCFGMENFGLKGLERDIAKRAKASPKDSYTARLVKGGVKAAGAKVTEEAEEVVRAAREETEQRVIEESADLFYHSLVLMHIKNVTLAEVEKELSSRRKH
ncbi:MAG TPA: bifunctional phosphoribosyl-AMP cyclohydrolase/phosphoribosyl-ATP diphosphatase HisIE [Candidatus Saccharimonadales bacterium]|nr:bifunctional phosphoribosyl-AMP cyclohydrolase/phosphoribosyl-ATP diphosphatase HisIE [Candidatus Saccharimonadales bacterium]